MKVEIVTNKDKEVLKTEDGRELQRFTFEAGDVFIPKFNKPIVKTTEGVNSKTKKKETYEKYLLKCSVKNKDNEIILNNADENEIFVELTPTQYKSFMRKYDDDKDFEANQHLWVAYNYESEKYGQQVGIGLKGKSRDAKSFEDFEEKTEE